MNTPRFSRRSQTAPLQRDSTFSSSPSSPPSAAPDARRPQETLTDRPLSAGYFETSPVESSDSLHDELAGDAWKSLLMWLLPLAVAVGAPFA